MRGKRRFVIASEIAVRITPAYAGKTPFFFLNGQIRKDHPRICGENPYVALKKGYLEGSPPHMRGKPGKVERFLHDLRITPAYAGKTMLPR